MADQLLDHSLEVSSVSPKTRCAAARGARRMPARVGRRLLSVALFSTLAGFGGSELLRPAWADNSPRAATGAGPAGERVSGFASRRGPQRPFPRCANDELVVTAATVPQAQEAALCLINRLRSRHHLRRLRTNRDLRRAAAAHAADMIRRRYFSHTDPDGHGHTYRIRATGYLMRGRWARVEENIGHGVNLSSTPLYIVQAWIASRPHRRNILNGAWRDTGLAIAPGPPEVPAMSGTYVQEFGTGSAKGR